MDKYDADEKEIGRLQILVVKYMDEIKELKEHYYFDMRNKQVEIETLKNKLKRL